MRQAILAMLLCACSSAVSVKKTAVPAERPSTVRVEAYYQEFYKELEAGHYDKAEAIADKRNLKRSRVVAAVLKAMWQKVNLTRDVGAGEAMDLAKKFRLTRVTEMAFARDIFAFLIKSNSCEIAADVALHFGLGPTYADMAIHCVSKFSSLTKARLACQRTGTKELRDRLVVGWLAEFVGSDPGQREYYLIQRVVEICELTAEQYAELYAIGMQDKQPLLVREILNRDEFKRTPADYDNFIALAVGQYQCDQAAEVALGHMLPRAAVEAILLNPKCSGGSLLKIDLGFVGFQRAPWFFELSLRAREFALARLVIRFFLLDKGYFDRAVAEGLAAYAYEQVLSFEPWLGARRDDYRDDILNLILDADEEWVVTLFVVRHSDIFKDELFFDATHRNAWIERAFLRAFHRDEFELAVDIAHQHTRGDFGDWATRLVFEAAVQAKNADSASAIARRWHLGKDAERRVMMLYWEKKKAEAKEQARERERKLKKLRKHKCANSHDWSVEPCK